MVPIGRYSTLKVVSISEFGAFLDGEEHGKILLPNNSTPRGTEIGHAIEVFIYFDSDERIIATTSHPRGEVGDFVLLKCNATNEVGSFMDWGLAKDLFVPFREQKVRLIEGEYYVVRIYEDPITDRLVGSTKLHQFYDKTPDAFEYNQEVNLLILYKMDLGYAALINQRYQGILYQNEVFRPLRRGDRCKGWIKNIRDDGKVDLALSPQGVKAIDTGAEQILAYLASHGGSMNITDESSPADIYAALGMSKKQFKKALGSLFRQEKISMSYAKVTLLPPKP
ncbi:MAG: GntR family transcriptional regulator [Fibrobacterota bacterium]|nr:GntR family transcriptional regulator [Fibrobacterota bacterium]QQS03364.1 MAG: GntR family transcriptional regulator [Fibrobacterota bacterium]